MELKVAVEVTNALFDIFIILGTLPFYSKTIVELFEIILALKAMSSDLLLIQMNSDGKE